MALSTYSSVRSLVTWYEAKDNEKNTSSKQPLRDDMSKAKSLPSLEHSAVFEERRSHSATPAKYKTSTEQPTQLSTNSISTAKSREAFFGDGKFLSKDISQSEDAEKWEKHIKRYAKRNKTANVAANEIIRHPTDFQTNCPTAVGTSESQHNQKRKKNASSPVAVYPTQARPFSTDLSMTELGASQEEIQTSNSVENEQGQLSTLPKFCPISPKVERQSSSSTKRSSSSGVYEEDRPPSSNSSQRPGGHSRKISGPYVADYVAKIEARENVKYASCPDVRKDVRMANEFKQTRAKRTDLDHMLSVSGDMPDLSQTLAKADSFHGITVKDRNSCSGLSDSVISIGINDNSPGWNVARNTATLLKDHKKKKIVVQTTGFKVAWKKLTRFRGPSIVVISGEEGDGVTWLGYELLLEASTGTNKHRTAYIINDPKDWDNCIDLSIPSAVLLKDPFGRDEINKKLVDLWRQRFDEILTGARTGTIMVIIASRNSILERYASSPPDAAIVQDNLVNISSEYHRLTFDDRVRIVRQHIHSVKDKLKVIVTKRKQEENLEKELSRNKRLAVSNATFLDIAHATTAVSFPKQCAEFVSSRENIKQGVEFFKRPAMYASILRFRHSASERDQSKFMALIVLFVYGGKLNLKTLEEQRSLLIKPENDTNKQKSDTFLCSSSKGNITAMPDAIEKTKLDIIMGYAEEFGFQHKVYQIVRNGISILRGSYVDHEIREIYCFSSVAVENSVAVVIGQDYLSQVIELCSKDTLFMCVRLSEESSVETPCLSIRVDLASSCSALYGRLVDAIREGNVRRVANHPVLSEPQYAAAFLDYATREKIILNILKEPDNETSESLLYHGLDRQFQPCAGYPMNISELILLLKKWNTWRGSSWVSAIKFWNRDEDTANWIRGQEVKLLERACELGVETTYVMLRERNVHVNANCLELGVGGRNSYIVEDLLATASFTFSAKNAALRKAVINHVRQPTESSYKIVQLLKCPGYLNDVHLPASQYAPYALVHEAAASAGAIHSKILQFALTEFKGGLDFPTRKGGDTALSIAAKSGCRDCVGILLEYKADYLKFNGEMKLPIHVASENDHADVVNLLLQKDVKTINAEDQTDLKRIPLHYASLHNNVDTVKLLISNGGDVKRLDSDKRSPLHLAAQSGKSEVVHFLIQAKADVSVRDDNFDTPLHVACESGNSKAVKRLLTEYANCSERLAIINNCLISASLKGSSACVELLLAAGAHDETCMFIAIKEQDPDLVELLCKHKHSVNCRSRERKTPLHAAIESGQMIMVQRLVECGADVNAESQDYCPVHHAVIRRNIDILKYLVSKQANLQAKTKHTKETVLHLASERNLKDILDFVLAKSTECMDKPNRGGKTPLHIAAELGHLLAAKCLVKHGADVSVCNKQLLTPIDIAKEQIAKYKKKTAKDFEQVLFCLTGVNKN